MTSRSEKTSANLLSPRGGEDDSVPSGSVGGTFWPGSKSNLMKAKPEKAREPEEGPSPEELADKVKAGDMAAFDELVLRFQKPMFNLAYRMLRNYEDANDAAQEIFVKVHRAIGKYHGRSKFSTWLYAVAANTCRSRLRSMKRRSHFEVLSTDTMIDDDDDYRTPTAVDAAPTPDTAAEYGEIRENVERIVSELPPDFSVVVAMKDLHDQSYEHIAESLGCSLGTVKSRLFRARAMVREQLEKLYSREQLQLC